MRSVPRLHWRGVSALWCLPLLFGLASACAPQDADGDIEAPLLTTHPSASTLTAGDELSLSALLDGVPTSALWSVREEDGGSVTPEGVYTAPATAGTFHVVARAGELTATAEVRVVPPPSVALFTAEPSSIAAGGSSRLRGTFDGEQAVLDDGIGAVASPFDVEVRPAATTVYTLRVTNAAGAFVDASATVTVDGIPPEVTVTISPTEASTTTEGTVAFTAEVHGASNQGVTWTVEEPAGGTIDASGTYTAPASAGVYHVTATSAADPTASDTATVAVTASGSLVTPDAPGAADVQIALDTRASHPISRLIYGVNLAESGNWGTLPANIGLSRFGGNRLSCFNWETNASNAGADWNYQNDENLVLAGDKSLGAATRRRADFAFARGAAFMATVTNIGYVAKDTSGPVATPFPNLGRFLVSKPKNPAGATATPSTTDGFVYQDDYVKWLDTTYPSAKDDPRKTILYSLDNEPDLWPDTHAQVRSSVPSWQEITQLNIEYAAAIKDVVPQAKVFGPAHYGWDGMKSMQGGARPAGTSYDYFFDYYLDELREAEARHGRRLVDAFDFHWYPEARSAANVRIIESGESDDMITARVQAPRSLWDPAYIENSWITSGGIPDCGASRCAIRLLPRLKEHIAARYPGTELAMTERWYGGGNYISGAIAEADVLGIFGREGMYAAALWMWGREFSCVFAGWRAFLDYDGAKSRFGDVYVSTSVADPQRTASLERVTAYGSIDASGDGRAVVIAINKTQSSLTTGLAVTANRRYAQAEVYRVTASSSPTTPGCTGPTRQADVALDQRNAFRATLPPLSITVFVLRP